MVQIHEHSHNMLTDTQKPLENTISRLNLISAGFDRTECCLSSEDIRVQLQNTSHSRLDPKPLKTKPLD